MLESTEHFEIDHDGFIHVGDTVNVHFVPYNKPHNDMKICPSFVIEYNTYHLDDFRLFDVNDKDYYRIYVSESISENPLKKIRHVPILLIEKKLDGYDTNRTKD